MGLFSQQIAQHLFNVGDIYLIQVHRMGALLTKTPAKIERSPVKHTTHRFNEFNNV